MSKSSLVVLSFLLIHLAALTSQATERSDIFVTQVAVHPLDPKIIYAVTTYSLGVLKSTDGGQHWALINNGIKSYSLYHFALHPKDMNVVYLGAGGGGLYKSVDGGAHWVERNNGFQDTDIGQMFLHPNDPEKIYVVSATGTYRTPDGGTHWEAWNQGDNFTTSQEFQNIVIMPGNPDRFFLASKRGLYVRAEGDPAWRLASKELEEKMISALAVDPTGKRLYAAAFRNGNTLLGGGLFVSEDFGRHWKRVDSGLERDWVRVIRFDPADPQRLYIATSNRGVLVSSDGGATWKESNQGLTATDLRALVLDPTNPETLYTGAHGEGIFKSTDRAATWTLLANIPALDSKAIIAQLTTPDPNRKKPEITPPQVFAKCNKCHGWTDPYLNTVNGFWLVPPNKRNWSFTVKRMSKGAGLTPDDEKVIADFLNAYSAQYGGTP
ncbi:MAG: hypothetical protein HY283_07555 [Nitrospirae bacterium]|nr:hypothetical protein [Nitrospirota bacterium]